MPFYLRKSISAGPFRFNFSKGGVGVSVGVKGLRIGTGPRGHYVHAGAGGLYYRATIRRAGEAHSVSTSTRSPPPPATDTRLRDNVDLVEVTSGNVLEMRDVKFSSVLEELNAKQKQISIANMLVWVCPTLFVTACFIDKALAVAIALTAVPAYFIGRWFDSFRRSTVLFYDLDASVTNAYEGFTKAFDQLSACQGKWHVQAGGAVQDLVTWKHNAGASHIVQKKPTTITYALPRVVKSNVTPPAIHVGKRVLYFLPDIVLMEDSDSFGALAYGDLRLTWQDSRFIEEGSVPTDSTVVGHTWKHPNKSGGPDRRFSSNYQIPICLYEIAHFKSNSGVNELIEVSKTGTIAPLARSIQQLSRAGVPRSAFPRLPN